MPAHGTGCTNGGLFAVCGPTDVRRVEYGQLRQLGSCPDESTQAETVASWSTRCPFARVLLDCQRHRVSFACHADASIFGLLFVPNRLVRKPRLASSIDPVQASNRTLTCRSSVTEFGLVEGWSSRPLLLLPWVSPVTCGLFSGLMKQPFPQCLMCIPQVLLSPLAHNVAHSSLLCVLKCTLAGRQHCAVFLHLMTPSMTLVNLDLYVYVFFVVSGRTWFLKNVSCCCVV